MALSYFADRKLEALACETLAGDVDDVGLGCAWMSFVKHGM